MSRIKQRRARQRGAWIAAGLLANGPVMAQGAPPMSEGAFWDDVPTVVSATRLSQSVVDVPQAVTVIDRRMIKASGAREIAELFRLVPGFLMAYHDGSTPSVSYHFNTDRFARQMQVLVDGRSVYTTAIGGVPWATLPITMDDIERIEVVRGPNSASYGANSFLGVINIITRHPVLDEGTSVKANFGDEGVREVFVRHGGGHDKLDYRVTAGYVEDDGFANRNDYKSTRVASLRLDYSLTNIDTLTFEAGVATGPRGVENRTNSNPEFGPLHERVELNHQQQIRWERSLGLGESVSLNFYHIHYRNTEQFLTETVTIPPGITIDPFAVDFAQNTHRYELELQHNASLSADLRAAWGAGLRDDQVGAGQSLMPDGDVHNHLRYAFANLEWAASDHWLFNAGLMAEDYSTIGDHYSPRAGVNYRFSPAHSLRLTGARAIRAPSMFEYAARYNFFAPSTSVGPITQIFEIGERQLEPEQIESLEFGYHGIANSGGLEFDVKLYRDVLTRVISSERIGSSAVRHYINIDKYVIEGVELEAKLNFGDDSALYFGYAYTEMSKDDFDLDDVTVIGVSRIDDMPQNSVSLLYMMEMGQGYSAGIGYYYTAPVQAWETGSPENRREAVRRLDLKVARGMRINGRYLELALAARNVLGSYPEMEISRLQSQYPHTTDMDSSAYLTAKLGW